MLSIHHIKHSCFMGDFNFKYILRKTCKIVRHSVRKIILKQTETRIFKMSYPIGRSFSK